MSSIIKSVVTVLAAGLIVPGASRVQAALSAGDLAVIGVNSDDPDEISFVALVEVEAGEVIYFTDNGWLESGSFRGNEGTFTYTVPAGGLSAGQIVQVALISGPQLADKGDQVLAYQGAASSPTFIYAINLEGQAVWQVDATSSYTSALPPGLVNGTTAIALPETDNAAFDTGVLTNGTKAAWLAAIGNKDHWIRSNSPRLTLPGSSESISVTSSGIDLRAFQTLEGTVVEFVAYDVKADGTIQLALMDESGEVVWQGSVDAMAGPQFFARFLVPGLELGESYTFQVRDEVGKWWEAAGVTVESFATEMTSASLAGITLSFDSLPEHDYEIQWVPTLGSPWQTITNISASGSQAEVVVPHPDPDRQSGFFRVQLK